MLMMRAVNGETDIHVYVSFLARRWRPTERYTRENSLRDLLVILSTNPVANFNEFRYVRRYGIICSKVSPLRPVSNLLVTVVDNYNVDRPVCSPSDDAIPSSSLAFTRRYDYCIVCVDGGVRVFIC